MKKLYIKPELTVNLFDLVDVITTSPNDVGHNFIDDGEFDLGN